MKKLIAKIGLIVGVFVCTSVIAGPHDYKVRELLDTDINAWLSDPLVIEAVKRQNAKHAKLSQKDIDKLDKKWRSERKQSKKPMINKVLKNKLSQYLRDVVEKGDGLYAEIFIMDNKGLNVGQNDVTSDYWQGDEGKWKKTYLIGPDSLLIDEIEYDQSAQRFQIQVSAPVVDPETKTNIGAVTIGLAMKKLAMRK